MKPLHIVALGIAALAVFYFVLPFDRYALVAQHGANAPVYEIDRKTGKVWDVTGAERRLIP